MTRKRPSSCPLTWFGKRQRHTSAHRRRLTLELLETRRLLVVDALLASEPIQQLACESVADISAFTSSTSTAMADANSDRAGWAVSTGLDGSNGDDRGRDIAVDDAGYSYVVGTTNRDNEQAIVMKLDPAGQSLWTHEIGGEERQRAEAVAVDSAGNVYVAGVFEGTVDFDPGTGDASRTSAGSFDMFLLKLDTDGDFVSVLTFGQSGGRWDYAFNVAVDHEDSVFLTGHFSGTVDFDPSPTSAAPLTANGRTDMFLLKLDAEGRFDWARVYGGPATTDPNLDYESSNALAVDAAGNVFVGGYFVGPADFDRESSYPDNRDILASRGVRDAFLAKYAADGSFQWARGMGGAGPIGTSYEKVENVAVDAQGNPHVIGLFQDGGFDPGDGSSITANGWFDVFISKFDANGTFVWSRQVGGTGPDRGYDIVVAESGDVVAGGFFNGTVDFDPSPTAAVTLTSRGPNAAQDGSGDGFLLRLDADGHFDSVRQYGGTGRDVINSMALDGPADILLTGAFESTAEFDVGDESVSLTSSGGQDLFAARVIEPLTGGEIHGLKWNDINGNGLREVDEPALADWTIYLDLNNNGQLDPDEPSALTSSDDPLTVEDETGRYVFQGLAAGTYSVAEVMQANWEQTFPTRGAGGVSSAELLGFGVGGAAVHASILGEARHDAPREDVLFDAIGVGGSDPFVVEGRKWPQPDGLGSPVTLTYSFSNLLDGALLGGLTASELRSAAEEALGLWASFAPLNFVEVADSGPAPGDTAYPAAEHADIRIGHHYIDGASGPNVLAHAYYPPPNNDGLAGDVHFDNANTWSIGPQTSAIDIVEVFVHEIGHSLGLKHEPTIDAIMNPSYGRRYGGLGTAFLLPDDIAGIQAVYGEREQPGPGTWSVTVGQGEAVQHVDFGNHNNVQDLPDLIVSDLRIVDDPTYDLAYEFTIKNVGTAPANLDGPTTAGTDNVSIQAFVSADEIFNNAGDIAAGGFRLGSRLLNPGETITGRFGSDPTFDPLTHPYLTLKVDFSDVVEESDESNNTAAVLIGNDQPVQRVTGPANVAGRAGQSVDVPFVYDTSDGDNTLTGLGLRIHFDSSFVTFDHLSEVLQTGFVAEQGPFEDSQDYDHDSTTDKYVLVAWADPLSGNWPNELLPANLLTASFQLNEGLEEGATSRVHLTAASNAAGYGFAEATTSLTVTAAYSLDIDEDGTANALTDGTLVVRHLFGFTGSILVNGAVNPDGERTDPVEIADYLEDARTGMLDADGNGTADALTDGTLIQRFLFGFRGQQLVEGALGAGATRTSPADIEDFLSTFVPGGANYEESVADVASFSNSLLAIDPPRLENSFEAVTVGKQIVTPTPQFQQVTPDDSVSVRVDYSTSPTDSTLTGLGLRIHFDSASLSFTELTNVLATGLIAHTGTQSDTNDFDNDPDTDRFVLIAWADALGGNWPGVESSELFRVDFTPQADFTGNTTVNFSASSTAAGRSLEATSAEITVAEPEATDALLGVRLQATDLDGNALTTVNVGDTFLVSAMVQDLRENPEGVFAAFVDLTYDSQLAAISGPIRYGERFPNVREGDGTLAGVVDEVGAVADLDPLGGGEFLLFSIPFQATVIGAVRFETDGADLLPHHESLLSGRTTPVPIASIGFGQATIDVVQGTIVAETDEDHIIDVPVTSNATFTVTSFDAVSNLGSTVTDNGDGTLRYDPRGVHDLQALRSSSERTEDSFTYTLRDAQGGTTVGTATITVTGINDAPVIVRPLPDSAALPTIENTIELEGVFADIEGDSLTYAKTLPNGSALPTWLRFDVEGLRLVATPGLDEVGEQVTVVVSVTDSGEPALSVSEEFRVYADNPYRNYTQPFDVNNDGSVTPLDALVIINELNRNRPRNLPMPPGAEGFTPPYLDVSNDLFVTPLDALLVINQLNAADLEGESSDGNVMQLLPNGTETTVPQVATILGLPRWNVNERVIESKATKRWHTESRDAIFSALQSLDLSRVDRDLMTASKLFDEPLEELLEAIAREIALKPQ